VSFCRQDKNRGRQQATFILTNIVPQTAANNQGVWANFENYLRDLVRNKSKEIYITSGVYGSLGTLKNEGKVKIPRYTWKIAVILNNGDNDISRTRDADVIAIVVPNQESLNSRDWENYLYTVDDIESMLTYDVNNYSDYDLKYDFLSVIPNDIEQVLESRKFDGVIN